MRFDVITLFPDMVDAVMGHGVLGRAAEQGLVELVTWNPRDYATDRHRTVDDRPYGGGPGMVMKVEPVRAAIQAARAAGEPASVVYLTPEGQKLDGAGVAALADRGRIILLCGRYEGIDQRLIELEVDQEISIGDYVVSGGELPAMVMMDAVARLLPGVLGHADSAAQDAFAEGLLDCPHYTRPEVVAGQGVPDVLLSGDHQAVARWRHREALGRTWRKRPDLLEQRGLSHEEQTLLEDYRREQDY
ncbi:MAG: tRNA (guanosine(37)-N1)-methyltransferase TrmD [Spiribacter salinus]|jgi:tRNA (guanine37-N1)-methyltransferase|uniref:tRNA (guanine-N(1)-)-methyltransferase n=1 Tax=Spiribacter salinus TaxID=1335746 RepID=A0A540VVD9_9GAMM|nr:tRNA (guanosine(37)-N1)-methyltransferase TrmD [Spiribacter sp.]MDR9454800.1 tRNA (guanosine(37)-N1)-methyltransferase TrmD [Spiribacter sp.]TQF00719.1 MAG: tRNA (guanosine(37)-N1)-methyltransferase TrmD [Spiribacter salinus]